ncbi:MATE family efflux transporter [Micromonospora purpureochromogenes]|uniref:MATE family efflux transporter n=1 Tax=Micromonospora purpureochromogenes TaxID=47872 RepID=UPI0034049E48
MTAPPSWTRRRPASGWLDPARLFPVAWPVYLELMSGVIAGIITVFWVARLGASELAAVTMTATLENVLLGIILAVSGGTTIVLSRAVGAADYTRVRQVLRAGLQMSIVASVVTCVVLFPLRAPLARFVLGPEDAEAARLAVQYLAWSIPGLAVFYGQHLLDSAFKADGDTRTPMRMAMLSNGILLFADPILIFGWMGAPRLGVPGSAIALVGSRAITLAVTWYLYRKSRLVRLARAAADAPVETGPTGPVRDIARSGMPLAIDFVVRMAAGLLIVGVIARFGTEQVAAYGAITRALLFLTMAAYAVRQAATIVSARAKGATDDRLMSANRASSVRLGIAWSLISGVLVLLCGDLAVGAITGDEAVRAAASAQVPWLAAYITLLLCNVTLSGIFLGGGRGRVLALTTTAGAVSQVALAPLLAWSPLGLTGAWLAMIINAGMQTVVLLFLAARDQTDAKEKAA